MTLLEYSLLAISSLFVIMDPVALVPVFLAMTPHNTPAERTRMARLACLVAAAILVLFAFIGTAIFKFLGITLPAFQMAGSIVLLLIALDMLRARLSSVQTTRREAEEGTIKEDIAVTPLGVPMLAGPGAISSTILLHTRAENLVQQFSLVACILAVCFASYLILRWSAHGARWLSPIVMMIVTRLMGLLLAAIAFQFMINALRDILPAGTLR